MSLYILDANTLIDAKNRYYDMSICPAFWEFIDRKNFESKVYSIINIYEELARGKEEDELVTWAKERKNSDLFLTVNDSETQDEYRKIVQYVNAHEQYSPEEKIRFLSEADPWIIAKAKTFEAKVVTHEVLVPFNSKKVKIPNICNQFDVEYITPFDFLKDLKAEFVLKN